MGRSRTWQWLAFVIVSLYVLVQNEGRERPTDLNCDLSYNCKDLKYTANTTFQGECLTDDDCSQLGNSYCDKQIQDKYQCACKDGFILVENNTKCLRIAPTIGSGCEFDEQCSHRLGTAVCANNQCRCAEGTSLKNDNTCGAAIRIALSLSSFVLVWMVKLL